jgi:hypothetical protein
MKRPVALLFFVLLVGCKEDPAPTTSSAQPDKAKPAASGAVTPAASPPACGPDAIKVPDPGFCVTAAGFKPGERRKSGDKEELLEFRNEETNDSFAVRWLDDKDEIAYKMGEGIAFYLKPESNDVVGHGELANGKGKWFYSKSKPQPGQKGPPGSTLGVYVQGPKYLFVCESAASADGPDQAKRLEICKSVTPL